MNRNAKTATSIILILLLGCSQAFTQTAEELLPKGIQLEEVNGELEEAIEVYQTIVAQYPENRSVAAKAYVHMGKCYEKLGKQDAQKAYKTVILDYADQENMVSEAKIRLAALNPSEIASNKNEMTVRKVWEQEDLLGETSPDGKHLSFVDWDTGDLAIYEIASGKKQRLTNKGSWEDPVQFAESSKWSPDGRFLVYGWYGENDKYDLRIFDLESSQSHVISNKKEISYYYPFDWSPDGSEILCYLSFEEKVDKIALIKVQDGSINILKVCDFWPTNMSFSSDGQYIVFDQPANKQSSNRDIYIMRRDGSAQHCLIQHPSDDFVQGWTPDCKHLLFSSDRDGSLGFYIIPVLEGISTGDPTLVKSSTGPTETLGFTPDGSFYYGIAKDWYDVYIAEIEPENGKAINLVTKLTTRFEGNNKEPDYSPEGKYLAYITWQSISGSKTNSWGGDVVVIRDLESGKEREFIPGYQNVGYPRWSPDGKSILMVFRNSNKAHGLCMLDVNSGTTNTVLSAEKLTQGFGRHQWSPDGKSVYYGWLNQENGNSLIKYFDLYTEFEKVIHESTKRIWQVFLSPDGKQLGFIQGGDGYGIFVLPSTGGKPREIFRFREEENVRLGASCSVAWSLDGKFIYFIMQDLNLDMPEWELCRISSEGGSIERLDLELPNYISNLSMHPDGRHISFSSISNPISPSVWVIENFLPVTE